MAWWQWFNKGAANRLVRRNIRRKKSVLRFDALEDRATPAVHTSLVSVALPTTAGSAMSITSASPGMTFSANDSLLVFSSDADNLVPGDNNGATDVFVANLSTKSLTRVSVAANGGEADGPSFFPSISADGHFIAFQSYASNLVTGDGNGTADIFVKDLQSGAVTLVSANATNVFSNNFSTVPAISANGQFVVFASFASNLTADDTDAHFDIFRKNVQTGQIDLVSKTSAGIKGNGDAVGAAISADGRYVAFSTNATNLLPGGGDANGKTDIYRKDMTSGTLSLVSGNAVGNIGSDDSSSPTISNDGNVVVFASSSNNLVAGDTNAVADIFAKDMSTQAVTRVSVALNGTEFDAPSSSPSINETGSLITFVTTAAAQSGDTNQANDIYLRNTLLATTTRVSTRSDLSQAARGGDGGRLSPSGLKMAFFTTSDDFDLTDNNGVTDAYIKSFVDDKVTLISHGTSANIGGNDNSFLNFDVPQLSGDGESVVFVSSATNLSPGADANGAFRDVYLRNIAQGTTTRVSATGTAQGSGDSTSVSANPTGSLSAIVFSSTSDNLATGDTQAFEQVYLKNPLSGAITPLSKTTSGDFGDGDSYNPVVSANGQYVAFITYASNLFEDTTFFDADVVVLNLATGVFSLVSADAAGTQVGGNIVGLSISDDGRYVAFASDADTLATGDANGKLDIFVKDTQTGTLTLVSKDATGTVGNGASSDPVISGDGRFVAFISSASNLVAGDTNGVADAFRSEWRAGANGSIIRVSTLPNAAQATGLSGTISISQEGRFVAFASEASNLVPGDTNNAADIFVKDTQTGAIYLASQSSAGAFGNDHSIGPSLSRDGRAVAYSSLASNLTADDTNIYQDVFLTTLNQAPLIVLTGTFTSAEGESLSLDASGTTDADGDALSFSWDLNGDGVFGDATGSSFTLTPAQLSVLGLGDGPNVRHARLVVSDSFGSVTRDFDLTTTNVPPTATITPGTVGTLEGQTASFTGSATDSSNADAGPGIVLLWDVTRNGTPLASGTGAAFTFNLVDDGIYLVTLTATDKDGGEGSAIHSFNVSNQPPTVASLNAPATTNEGALISFLAAASDPGSLDQGAGLTLNWSVTKNSAPFKSGSGGAVAFTPDDNGTYVVSVTATDKDLAVSTATTASITVADVAPDLHIASTGAVNEGASYSIALAATDPGADAISSWVITWGDGSAPETFAGTATSASHTYANGPATRTLAVVATDEDGQYTAAQSVTVADIAPTLILTGSSTAVANATYQLHIGPLVDPGLEAVSSVVIDWGDATTTNLPGSAFNADYQHTYLVPANVHIRVNVTNSDGSFEAANKAITIATNVAPTIAITGPASSAEGMTYSLALGAIDNPDAQPITGYHIAWGDGETTAATGLPPTSATHIYADGDAARAIIVSLMNGEIAYSSPATKTVAITDVAPTVTLTAPPSTPEGASFTLTLGSIVDPGADTVSGYVLQWGDGTIDADSGLPPLTFTHAYVNGDADRTVTLTLSNEDGSHTAGTNAIHVANVAPSFDAGADTTLTAGDTLTRSGSFTDPGADTWTATVDYGDGLGAQPLVLTGKEFTLNHVYSQHGSFTVTVTIVDGDSGSHSDSFAATVAIANVNGTPTFEVGADASLNEGEVFARSGSFADPDNNTWTATVDYGDGLGVQPLVLTGKNFTLNHVYPQQGVFPVTVTISDGVGGSSSDSFTITVANVAPVFQPGPDRSLPVGTNLVGLVLFTDPGADTWTATVNYGDGGGDQPLAINAKHYVLSHIYTETGPHTVTVAINDGTTTVSHSFVATVTPVTVNVAPSFEAGNNASISEGDTFARAGAFTDPDPNTWSATVDYGDGSGNDPLTLVGKTYNLSHTYTRDGSFTVTISISDGTETTSHSFQVTSANVAPTVSAGNDVTLAANGVFAAAGSFLDPGADTWTATVDYGDNTGVQPLTLAGKTFNLNHTYTQAGTFAVLITVNDGLASGSDSLIVTHAAGNNLPVITLPTTASILEGGTFTQAGSFADTDTNTWTATVDYGLGAGPQPLTLTNKTFSLSQSYPNNGSFPVKVVVSDGISTATATLTLTVANVAPAVVIGGNGTAFTSLLFTRAGGFTDPGADTWTATVNYGDNTGVQPLTLSGKGFALSHTYTQTGNFTVIVTVSDGTDNGTATFNVQVNPLDLTLSANTVAEKSPNGTVVGNLTTGDGGVDNNLTFSLVNNAGGRFALNDNVLVVANGSLLDSSTATSQTIRARITGNGHTFEKDFTIQVVAVDHGDDFVGRDPVTGELFVARSSGSSFATTSYHGVFDPSKTWVDVSVADFDGDGRDDVIARDQASGEWWLAHNTGDSFVLNKWDTWSATVTFVDVKVFDLNGDNKSDILGRNSATGAWSASFSQGTTGHTETIGNWDPSKSWVDAQFGDFNKDGRIDILGRLANTGQLFVSLNQANAQITGNAKLINLISPWATLSDGNAAGKTAWVDVLTADVDGDGRLDYLGRVQGTGNWYVSLGTSGKARSSQFWTTWSTNSSFAPTSTGDVNGDGKADLIGHTLDTGKWMIAQSPATAGGTVTNKDASANGFFYSDVFVGDFNHDGKSDVAGLRTGTGAWSVGISGGNDFSFSDWDTWPTNPARLAIRRGRFAN